MKDTGVVNIRGKQYQTVALRVQQFRQDHPNWSIQTEVFERTNEYVVMKASILDDTGRVLATGHAEEYRKSSSINATSALENCETSSLGRALAALGYLGGGEFASADELQNAINNKPAFNSVPKQVLAEQDAGTQKRLSGIADTIRIELTEHGAEAALKVLDEHDLDADTKVALWALLDSKERASLKAARKAA